MKPHLFVQLRKAAPSIIFNSLYIPDDNYVWEGDGPDPREEGYETFNVDVGAKAIVNGVMIEGHDYLGGVYGKHGEFDPEIDGYLGQMVDSALDNLKRKILESGDLPAALAKQITFAKIESRERYDR